MFKKKEGFYFRMLSPEAHFEPRGEINLPRGLSDITLESLRIKRETIEVLTKELENISSASERKEIYEKIYELSREASNEAEKVREEARTRVIGKKKVIRVALTVLGVALVIPLVHKIRDYVECIDF